MPDEPIVLSVIVPVYNEEATLPALPVRLKPVLDSLGVVYEVLAVDDGSSDRSLELLQAMESEWPELHRIQLLRNFGQQAAMMAGLARARGLYCVTIDADLQDPPEAVGQMLAEARDANVDVVYGVREDRSADGWLKRSTAALFYRLMRRLSGPQVPYNASEFRLMSRRVVDAVNALPESGRVLRLAVPWFGFPSSEVRYARQARTAGSTKYTFGKLIALAVDAIASFSAAPLRIATFLGFLGVLSCFALILLLFFFEAAGMTVPGWASTLLIVAGLGAVQLIALGLLGEYVGRLFEMAQHRPRYVIGHDTLHRESPSGIPEVQAPEEGRSAD